MLGENCTNTVNTHRVFALGGLLMDIMSMMTSCSSLQTMDYVGSTGYTSVIPFLLTSPLPILRLCDALITRRS